MGIKRNSFDVMGFAMRTKDYRYIKWRSWLNSTLQGDWSRKGLLATVMFDHRAFFKVAPDFENLAGTAAFAQDEARLAAQLRAAYDGAE